MLYEQYTNEILGLKDAVLKGVEQTGGIKHIMIQMPTVAHQCPRCVAMTARFIHRRIQGQCWQKQVPVHPDRPR